MHCTSSWYERVPTVTLKIFLLSLLSTAMQATQVHECMVAPFQKFTDEDIKAAQALFPQQDSARLDYDMRVNNHFFLNKKSTKKPNQKREEKTRVVRAMLQRVCHLI